MTTKVPGAVPRRLSGVTLWLAFSTLAGCNVMAGLFGVGFSSSSESSRGAVAPLAAPRELSVSLRPGVSLLQAAEQAPRAMSALSRAARGLGEVSLLDGKYLRTVSTNLLDEGLLLPGPFGMLEVRMDVQPIVAEPIAVTAVEADSPGGLLAAHGCTTVAVPASLVGAYRAGSRLLLLRADGQFVLQGGSAPAQTGSYALGCQLLQLAGDASAPRRLVPFGDEGWQDQSGSTFLPLTAKPHGDVP